MSQNSPENVVKIASHDLFAGYNAAAARLAEAKDILAINPNHPPAQERVDDALRMVSAEIGRYLEKSRPANVKSGGTGQQMERERS